MNSLFSVVLIMMIASGCVSKRPVKEIILEKGSCESQLDESKRQGFEVRLNALSILFERGCYQQVISLGSEIRKLNRDKYYSVSDELAEVVVYEGMVKDYVLDSHERIFLSLLIAISYSRLGDDGAAKVELKKAYEESVAEIYAPGTDEVNVFLQGLLWYSLGEPESAEPFFKKILEDLTYSKPLKIFVESNQALLMKKKTALKVYSVNRIPEVTFNWISTYSEKPMPWLSTKNCIAEKGLLLTTSSWVDTIKSRDNTKQDPVLNYKRSLRLPATAFYSLLVLVGGGALTLGAAHANMDGRVVVLLGAATIYGTYRTFVNGLAPDMRNWYELPEAFFISLGANSVKNDPCMRRYQSEKYNVQSLFWN